MKTSVLTSYFRFMLILLVAVLVWGCSSQQEKLVGKYIAVKTGEAVLVPASLELLPEGKGFWSIDTDNAPFRWDLYQNKIRLHTRSGGVIEGTLGQDTLQFTLPGTGQVLFQRE